MRIIIAIALVLNFFMCNTSKNKHALPSESCIALNDSGMVYIMKYDTSGKKNYLNTSLSFFDRAIQCDSNYVLPWHNKLAVFSIEGNSAESFKCLDRMLQLTDNDPTTYFRKGNLLESYGYKDSAYVIYGMVYNVLDKRLKNEKEFNLSDVETYLLTSAIIGGVDEGESRYDSILRIYRGSSADVSQIHSLKPFIDNIENKNYLSGASLSPGFTNGFTSPLKKVDSDTLVKKH